jgi:anti-anti-sigma factor
MPAPHGPILDSCLERGVLVLTVKRSSIQGDEVADELRKELRSAADRTGSSRVVIDLSCARYVSSIAFWPLLSLRRWLQERGGRLLICGLSGAVADVFHTTKMVSAAGAADAPFEVATDRAEAITLLAGPAPPA